MDKRIANKLLHSGKVEIAPEGAWRIAVEMFGDDPYAHSSNGELARLFGSILQKEANIVLRMEAE